MGASAGLAADDYKLGGMLAETVVEAVVKGTPVNKIPVKQDPEPKIVLSDSLAK